MSADGIITAPVGAVVGAGDCKLPCPLLTRLLTDVGRQSRQQSRWSTIVVVATADMYGWVVT